MSFDILESIDQTDLPHSPQTRRLIAQYGTRLERLSHRVKWLLVAGFSVHCASFLSAEIEYIDLTEITEFIEGFVSLTNEERGDLNLIFSELEEWGLGTISAFCEVLSKHLKLGVYR